MKRIIISFISIDRPGLVDAISNAVKQFKGNWQNSSLHHMSGFFSGVIEIAVEQSNCDTLIAALNDIDGLESNIKVTGELSEKEQPSVILELTANDRAGIVQEISSVIHHQGGNLLKVVSKTETAQHSGQELFKAKVTVSINQHKTDELIEAIEGLADDLIVDVSR
jgi:glycine cleavage system regulatory protein